ncbi:MAG: hypothetical protein ACXVBC_12025, partial [Bdellovibrionota bacterium]
VVGAFSGAIMMLFMDLCNMAGISKFSFEIYLGTLITQNQYSIASWTLGVICNWIVGGIFGLFYAYMFEIEFKRSGVRLGTLLGFAHTALAAFFLFPFFNMLHEQISTGLYPNFGILGSGLGPQTPILILAAHLLYGMNIGLFYGPVRTERVRARYFEPGETGLPGEPGVVTNIEDARDRWSA